MDSQDFEKRALADPNLSELLWEAAQNSGLSRPNRKTFATGLEPIVVLACYVLFRWSKIVLDSHERKLELDSAKQQIEFINQLVRDGMPREQAEKLVMALLDGINSRKDDLDFKTALNKILPS